MNYKELIEQCRRLANRWENGEQLLLNGELRLQDVLRDDATAIETLLAEREAAVKLLRTGKSRCDCCMHNESSIHEYPCRDCKDCGGMSDYWQWRGVRKQE